MKTLSFTLRLALLFSCLTAVSCEVAQTGRGSFVIRPKQGTDGTPWFMLNDQGKMEASLDNGRLAEAEEYLKKGANPNFRKSNSTIGVRSAVYFYTYYGNNRERAALLVKYGARRSDMTAAAAQRKKDDAIASDRRYKRDRASLAAIYGFFHPQSRSSSRSSGGPLSQVKCGTCGGSGTVGCPASSGTYVGYTCPHCHGTYRVTCPGCAGKGYTVR